VLVFLAPFGLQDAVLLAFLCSLLLLALPLLLSAFGFAGRKKPLPVRVGTPTYVPWVGAGFVQDRKFHVALQWSLFVGDRKSVV
jgi:hypothetical protein